MNSAYNPSEVPQHAAFSHSHGHPAPPSHVPVMPGHHPYQRQQPQLSQQQPPPPPPLPHSASSQHHQHHQHQHQQQHPHQHPHHHQVHHQHHTPPPPPPPNQLHQQSSHRPLPQSGFTTNGSPQQDENIKDEDSASQHHKQQMLHQQLLPVSRVEETSGRRYSLDVVQQPKRARMCGYGDKDRRPITPPPCVRLVITDIATGKEVNYKDIDHSMFVLNVDLWNEQGGQEVNLCRQPASTGGPSLSATPAYGYGAINGGESASSPYSSQVLASGREPHYGQSPAVGYGQDYQIQNGYGHTPSYHPNGSNYGPPQQYYPQDGVYRSDQSTSSAPSQRFEGGAPSLGYSETSGPSVAYVHDQYKGALNRNLIGSVAASAFCLTDTNDREGIWFVLQDLSVRLEGSYRLKFSFVNVGTARERGPSSIVKGKVPILSWCFSDSFNVYSAKKFPGVCESTALSKTFATQGIKIPIRKDGNKGGDDDDGD